MGQTDDSRSVRVGCSYLSVKLTNEPIQHFTLTKGVLVCDNRVDIRP